MLLGVNGYPFSWTEAFQTRWDRVRTDPTVTTVGSTIERHWRRLDYFYKYCLTRNSAYIPTTWFVGLLTTGWNGQICGTKPFQATITAAGSDAFLINFQQSVTRISEDGRSLDGVIALLQEGNAISFQGTLPAELVAGNTYYIVNVTQTIMAQGVTSSYGSYRLRDTNTHFATKGLFGFYDLVVNTGSNQRYPLRGIDPADDTILFLDSDRVFAGSGVAYKIIRYTFKISETLGGSPITFANGGNAQFQPGGVTYYYPAHCDWGGEPPNENNGNGIGLDNLRDTMLYGAHKYAIYFDDIPTAQKLIINDVYYNLFVAMTNGSTQPSLGGGDYDNWHYSWLAITIFALTIEDEFPTIYSNIVNHQWYINMTNDLASRFSSLTYYGGRFPDSMQAMTLGTNYDPSEAVDLIQYFVWIDNFRGYQQFPELYTIMIPKMGEFLKNYFTSIYAGYLGNIFQYSDNQNIQNASANTYTHIAILADLNNDPDLWYMWDVYDTYSSIKYHQGSIPYTPYENPYATRTTKSVYDSRTNIHRNDNIRAVTFYHSSFKPDCSAFYCAHLSDTGSDHNPFNTDIGLWRKREKCIDWAIGYVSYEYHWSSNCLIPFGVYDLACKPHRTTYRHGTNWVYTKGTKSSANAALIHNFDSNIADGIGGGSGNINEQTRHIFYIHASNGADHIVIFDTLETPPAIAGTATRTMGITGETATDVPNGVRGVEGFRTPGLLTKMKACRYRHQFNWFVPCRPTQSGNSWTWFGNTLGGFSGTPPPGDVNNTGPFVTYTAGSQKVTLTTFVNNYTSGVYDGNAFQGQSDTYPPMGSVGNQVYGAMGFFLRIVPENEQFGRFNWLHAYHVRDTADPNVTYTQLGTDGLRINAADTIEVNFNPFSLTINGVSQTAVSDSSSSSCCSYSSSSSCRSSSSSCRSSSSSCSSSSCRSSSCSSSCSSCRSSSSSCSSSSSRSSSSSSRSSSSSSSSCRSSSSSSRSSSSSSRSSSSSSRSSSSSSKAPSIIVVDAFSSTTGTGAGPFTRTHTIGASDFGQYLLVGVTAINPGTIAGVAWGSTPLTLAVSRTANIFANHVAQIWYLKNPTPGANTVTVSTNGSTQGIGISVLSLFRTNQAAPEVVGGNSGDGGSIQTTIAPISNQAFIFDCVTGLFSNSSWTPTVSGQVETMDTNINQAGGHASSYYFAANIASYTMGWQYNSGGQGIAQAVVVISNYQLVSSSSSSSCRSSSSSSSRSSSSSSSSSKFDISSSSSCRSSSSSSCRSSSSSSSSLSSSSSSQLPTGSAIVVDSTANEELSNASAVSYEVTVGGGANRMLIVTAGAAKAPAASYTVSSVKFNELPLTLHSSAVGQNVNSSVWYLINPPVGAYIVTVTFRGLADTVVSGAISLRGVRQGVPPLSSSLTGVGTTASLPVTTLDTDSIIIDATAFNDANFEAFPGGQQVSFCSTGLFMHLNSSYKYQSSAGATTMRWTTTKPGGAEFAISSIFLSIPITASSSSSCSSSSSSSLSGGLDDIELDWMTTSSSSSCRSSSSQSCSSSSCSSSSSSRSSSSSSSKCSSSSSSSSCRSSSSSSSQCSSSSSSSILCSSSSSSYGWTDRVENTQTRDS